MHSERKVTLNRGGVADKNAADPSNPRGKFPTPEVKVTEHQYPHPFFCLPNVTSFNCFLLFVTVHLSMFSFIFCQDQKRMSELVSYLLRQRTHTPPDKTENKQKTKEVRLSLFCHNVCICLLLTKKKKPWAVLFKAGLR